MKHITRLIFVMFVFVGLVLSGCGAQEKKAEKISPSKLEKIDGTELSRVILTEKAAQRIGLQTVSVSGTTIPYAAVVYDTEGNTWVYTNPKPLTFVRAPVAIDHIEGDIAVLSKGLEKEIAVVTMGVAELYGAETGVSK